MRYNKGQKWCAALVIGMVSIMCFSAGFYLLKPSSTAEPSLQFISIIFRHGERAPVVWLPEGMHSDLSLWPEGLGSLLQIGKVNMFKLGRFLRRRYDGFLSVNYSPAELKVISSDVDRCIMSAQLVLAGLYPPVGIQKWNADLLWQPVPVHSLPRECDDKALGLPRPDWYDERIFKWIRTEYFFSFTKTDNRVKLESGVLINEIVTNMKRKIDSATDFSRRLQLYAAHDLNLIHLWRGLNVSQEITDLPSHGAALLIELHKINGKYLVKILYKNNADDEDLTVLKTVACQNNSSMDDDLCDFDHFSSALQSNIITNFDEACRIPDELS
ncbi:testicular acid phosphatase homolog isoform X3 [Bemisia tabaci]|uniref:testicular acid phosphatase homolog isoform X3 n=1 Tax=Bemisia tabaci TaxID=7038 RepID=UPI003B2835FF